MWAAERFYVVSKIMAISCRIERCWTYSNATFSHPKPFDSLNDEEKLSDEKNLKVNGQGLVSAEISFQFNWQPENYRFEETLIGGRPLMSQ